MNDLKHFGVLGMKWGVRKRDSNYSSDYKQLRDFKKKGLKNLSNDELRTAVKRMRLEKKYRDSALIPGKSLKKMSTADLENEVKRNKLKIEVLKTYKILGLAKLRSIGKMDNSQVKAALERTILEKQYKDIRKEDVELFRKLYDEIINKE